MKILIIIFMAVICLQAEAQDHGTIYIARKKMQTGVTGELKVFIDGKAVCKVGNNKFSINQVTPGNHLISVQYGGTEAKDKAMKEGVPVEVVAGKKYYFKAAMEVKALIKNVYLEEITEATWVKYAEKLNQDNCL